ncbi:ROK family protein [Rubritalea tangerina]|uniref:fructokinase n=1 Tax=Rubritalea tangerina TaxID=430798 RepID=A0ABW4ZDW7_9BACT
MKAGIELGGTKTVVGIAGEDNGVRKQHRFPTGAPEETVAEAVAWLREQGEVCELGVAAFGPISVNRQREDYGKLLATPKQGWGGFDLVGALEEAFPAARIVLDTDVNAAALAEVHLGVARGHENVGYITIGTGIGAGFVVEGRVLHGALHSEFGHLKVPRHADDDFEGVCPYHGDCLEGMASGTSLIQRYGRGGHEIAADEPAWDIEAWYLAHGILSMLAILSPSLVVLGGGVSQAEGFHAKVEACLREVAGGYFTVLDGSHRYVVAPGLGQNAGIQGAFLLLDQEL